VSLYDVYILEVMVCMLLQVIGEDARVDPATGQRAPQLLCELPRQYLLTVPGGLADRR
jgi:hypothetical protein